MTLLFSFFAILFSPPALAEDVTIADFSDPRPRVYSRGHEVLTLDLNQIIPFLEPGWNLDAFLAGGDIDYLGPGTINGISSTFLRAYNNSTLKDTPLFALPGNHEVDNIYDIPALENLHDSYPDWNLKPGPATCPETTYSFDKGDIHFSILNVYCNEDGPIGSSGDMSEYLFEWLKNDLRTTDKKYKIVAGHEPAYPNGRHEGDSLDVHPENRDRFWNLLVTEKVFAYLAGHVHISRMASFDGVFEMNTGTSGTSRNSGIGSNPFTTINYIHSDDDGILIKQVRESRTDTVSYSPPAWPAATSETKTMADINKEVLVNTHEKAGTENKYWVDYDSSVEANPDWSANNNGKWWEKDFDDSGAGWSAGEMGVGYAIFEPDKWGWLNTSVNPDPNSSGSIHTKAVFQRIPFSVYDKDKFSNFKLGLDYSGGVTAWLNGTKVYESSGAPAFNDSNYAENFDRNATSSRVPWGKEELAPSFQDIDISQYKDLLNNGEDNLLVIANWNGASDSSLASAVKLTLQPFSGPYKYWVSYNDCADYDKSIYASTGNVSNGGGDEDVGDLVANFNGVETDVQFAYDEGSPLERTGPEDDGGSGREPPVYPKTGTDAYSDFGTKINMGAINYSASGVPMEIVFDNLSSEKKYELVALGMRGKFNNKWCRYTLSDASSFSNISSTGTEISSYKSENDSATYNCGDNYENGYVAKWKDIIPGSSTLRLTIKGVSYGSWSAGEGFISAFKLVEQKPGNPTLSSDSTKHYALSNESVSVPSASFTVQDDPATPTIKATKDIRIGIPSNLALKWDTSLSDVSVSGSAAGKVTTSFTFENNNKYLVIPVNSDFSAGDTLTVSGLKFTAMSATSAETNLQLIVDGSDGYPIAYDDKGISLGRPTISSEASKVFAIGGSTKTMPVLTLTEDSLSRTIKADKDIRIHIPDDLNLKWDSNYLTMEITGNASSKIASTTAVFQNDNKTLFIDVGEDFNPRDTINISGLYLNESTAPGSTGSLKLEVDNEGNIANSDDKAFTVAPMPIVSIAENSSHPSNVSAGSTNVIMGIASIVSTASGTGVNSITVKENGTINAMESLQNTELWLSNDTSLDGSDNQLDTAKSFTGLDGNIIFSEAFTVGTETKYLILKTNIEVAPIEGRKVHFSFYDSEVEVDCSTSNFPLSLTGQTLIDPIPVTWLTDGDWSAGEAEETIFVHDNKVGIGYFDDFNTSLDNNKWSDNSPKWSKEGVATGAVDVSNITGGAGTGYLHVTSPNKLADPTPTDLDTTHGVFNLPPGKTLNPRYTLWYNGVIIRENSDAATSFSKGRSATYMYKDATAFFTFIGTTHWGAYRLTRSNGSYASTYFSGSAVTPVGVVSPVVIPGSPVNIKATVNGTSATTHTHNVYATNGIPTNATLAHTDTTNLTGARTFAFSAAYHYLQNAYQNILDSIWLRGGFSDGSYTSGWKDAGDVMPEWGIVTISASITGDQSISMVVRSSLDGEAITDQTTSINITDGDHDYDISSLAAGRYLSLAFVFNSGTTNDTPTVNSASWSKVVHYPTEVPGNPLNFETSQEGSSNNVSLSWESNLNSEDVFYLDKKIDFGSGFGSWEELAILDEDATSFIDNGEVQANERYQYRIRSANGIGFSGYTESGIVQTPPATPSSVTGNDIKKDSIRWAWSDNSFFEEGFRFRFLAGGISETFEAGSNATEYESNELTPNTGYQIGLKSFQGSQESAEVNSETYRTLAPDPINFQAVAEPDKMTLSVDAFPNDDSGQSGYYFYNDTDEVGSGWITENSWEAISPKNNTIYEYQVIQRNYDGIESGLNCYPTARCYPKEEAYLTRATLAPAPNNFDAMSGSTTVRVSVDPFLNDTLQQSGYYFENETRGTNSGWIIASSWEESDLERNTNYTYKVKQRNLEGVETESVSLNKPTLAPPPQNFSSSAGSTSVRLTVDAFINDKTGSSGYYFENQTKGTNSGWTTTSSWEEILLDSNTSYTYRVKQRNFSGLETENFSLTKTTLAPTPTVFEAESTSRKINLSVKALTNDKSGQSGYYFENETKGTNSGWITSNSWEESDLDCGNNYAYRVKYRNQDGIETDFVSLEKETSVCTSDDETFEEEERKRNLISVPNLETSQLSEIERVTIIGNRLVFRSVLANHRSQEGKMQIRKDDQIIKQFKIKDLGKCRVSLLENIEPENAPHDYQLLYFDLLGNLLRRSDTYYIIIDKKNPTINSPGSILRKKPGENVVVRATDNGKIAGYSFVLRGKNYGRQTSNTFVLPSDLPSGKSSLTISVFDGADNVKKRYVEIINN